MKTLPFLLIVICMVFLSLTGNGLAGSKNTESLFVVENLITKHNGDYVEVEFILNNVNEYSLFIHGKQLSDDSVRILSWSGKIGQVSDPT